MLTAFYLASTESTFHYYMKESNGRELHGRRAEDEKIREDSNEGLDSSSSNGGGSSSNDDDDVAFDAATAVTAVLLAIQL